MKTVLENLATFWMRTRLKEHPVVPNQVRKDWNYGFTYLSLIDSIKMLLLPLHGLFPDTPYLFSLSDAHSVTIDWTKKAHTYALVGHLVTYFCVW